MDVLDKLMVVLGVYVAVCAAAAWRGYLLHAVAFTAALFALLRWVSHRRRPGPTGFSKFDLPEDVLRGCDLTGRVVMVTGATSGIGEYTALALAKHGAHVVVVGRSQAKIDASMARIRQHASASAQVTPLAMDLSDMASIRAAAARFLALDIPLHVLVCNAGIMAVPPGRTRDGFERQVGTNHLGHFLLVQLLAEKLRASAPSRVVVLSSVAHRLAQPSFFSADNAALDTAPYDPWHAYGNAKLCNLMFARALNERLEKDGVQAVSVHPGGIFTGLQGDVDKWTMFKWMVLSPFAFKTVPQGASTTVLCATAEEVQPGQYYEDCNPSAPHELVCGIATDRAKCDWLWERSEALVRDKGLQ